MNEEKKGVDKWEKVCEIRKEPDHQQQPTTTAIAMYMYVIHVQI